MYYRSGIVASYSNDTSLCEPADQAFQEWLATIPDLQSTGALCVTPTAEPSFDLHQDPADGATGLKVDITQATTGSGVAGS